MPDTDLAMTDALTRTRGKTGTFSRRQDLLATQGTKLVSGAGFGAPIVAMILKRAMAKGIELDQQDAGQFAAELTELLSDRETGPQEKFIDAVGLAQKHGLEISDVTDLIKDFKGLAEDAEEKVPGLTTKDQIASFVENLPEGANVKADFAAEALGITDLAGSMFRVSYTKPRTFEEGDEDLATLEARKGVGVKAPGATKAATPVTPAKPNAREAQLRKEAEEAIRKGADPGKVRARLVELLSKP